MAQAGPRQEDKTLGWMLFSPKGRIPRFDALFSGSCIGVMFAALALVWIACAFAYHRQDPAQMMQPLPWLPLGGLVLLMAWMCLCVFAKRCHDRDRSAWFLLVALIPVVNLWTLVELFFLRGTRAGNRFGPEPEGMVKQWRAANEDR